MKQDEIIEMAIKAKILQPVSLSTNKHWRKETIRELTAFAALVASAEREACAEICKKHADFYAGLEPSPIAQSAWAACVDNRDTIRAREQA